MSVIGLPATIFRNFAIRQKTIRQKVLGNRNIGNLYSAKVNNESINSAKYFLETDICHSSPQTDICQQTRHRKISISRSVIQKKDNYCRMTNCQLQIFQMVNFPSKNLPNGRVAKLFGCQVISCRLSFADRHYCKMKILRISELPCGKISK